MQYIAIYTNSGVTTRGEVRQLPQGAKRQGALGGAFGRRIVCFAIQNSAEFLKRKEVKRTSKMTGTLCIYIHLEQWRYICNSTSSIRLFFYFCVEILEIASWHVSRFQCYHVIPLSLWEEKRTRQYALSLASVSSVAWVPRWDRLR